MLQKAIQELRMLAMKADATGEMRVSISFANIRDKAVFLREVSRELTPQIPINPNGHDDWTEFQLHGVKVRII